MLQRDSRINVELEEGHIGEALPAPEDSTDMDSETLRIHDIL